MKRTVRLIFSLVFLAISLPLIAWGFWPPRREVLVVPLLPVNGMPSLPEARTIRVESSPRMRAGDSQIVELNLSAGEAEAEADNLYEEYVVIAEARLELAFTEVRPAEVVSTALEEGGSATFYWEVNPRETGALGGTAWLYLRLVPRAGGEEVRQPVSAQWIEIHSTSFWGRTGAEARWMGVAGFLISLALGIPFLRKRTK